MSTPAVRIEEQDHICTIIIDRPHKKNAVDRPTAEALYAAFEHFEADANLRVAVLWGANGTFCSGADLTAMHDPETRNSIDPEGKEYGPMSPTRMALSKPVIAAISGYAVAGGLELSLLCDLRAVTGNSITETRRGMCELQQATDRQPREIDAVIDPFETQSWIVWGLKSVKKPGARHGLRRPMIDIW